MIFLRNFRQFSLYLYFTSIVSILLIIGGLIMLMLGIIGEYVGRIYILLSDMPQYEVRDVINKEECSDED